MTKEDLKKVFDLMDTLNTTIDKFQELGVDFVETPFYEVAGIYFDMILESNYTEEGHDWINWWYFERRGCPSLKAYDEEGNEMPCETFDELYEIIKQYEK